MEEYPFSLIVQYSKELNQKQERDRRLYFSVKRRSNGGECLVTKLGPTLYRVSYKKKEVMERVLNYSDHKKESCGELLEFTLKSEEFQEQTSVPDSEEMSDDGATASASVASAIIEIQEPSENVLVEQDTFIFLDSDCQYAVIKDKITNEILTTFPFLKVDCDNKQLKLTGHGDLKEPRDLVRKMINLNVKERRIEVSPAIAVFLLSWDSSEITKRLFHKSNEGLVFLDMSGIFRLYASTDTLLDNAEMVMQQGLKEENIQIRASATEDFSLDAWKEFLASFQNDRHILMTFQENHDSDSFKLSIAGFTESVEKTANACRLYLCQKATVNEEIDLEHRIIVEYLDDLLKLFGTASLPVTVKVKKSKGQNLSLIGPRDDVNTCKAILQGLTKLYVENLCISRYGAAHFCKNQRQELLKKLEVQFKCRIFICDSESGKHKAESTLNDQNVLRDREGNSNRKENLNTASTSQDMSVQQTKKGGSSKRSEIPKKNHYQVQLVLSYGKLEDKKANVLVAPLLSNNPHLEAMDVTKSLKQKGGDQFANLFLAVLNNRVVLDPGSIFPLPVPGESYRLDCDFVIFIVCPQWDGPTGSSSKALKRGVRAMLEFCNSSNQRLVTMSVIGPGKKLRFPEETSATLIGKEIKLFVESAQNLNLKKIELVIPQENQTLYIIYRETLLHMDLGAQIIFCNHNGGSFEKISFGKHDQVKVNNILVVVTYNDITKETTDAIVNITNFRHWREGSVAHAIFSAAGEDIVQEANCGVSGKLVLTGSGALPCKWIIHCDYNNKENILTLVKDILHKCDSVGLKSVAIPAVGTGERGINPAEVAHLIMNAILTVVRTKKMTFLTYVRLVTFRSHIYHHFSAELRNCFKSFIRSSWNAMDLLTSRLRSQWIPDCDAIKDLKDLRHPAYDAPALLLVIVADLEDNAKTTKLHIKEEFDKQYKEEKIEQALLPMFSLEEIQDIFSVVNEQPEVQMILDREKQCIFINGCEKDVYNIAMKVQTKLAAIVTARLQKVTLETGGLLIQWGYSDVEGSHPFTVDASQILEDRFQAASKEIVTIKTQNGKQVWVNLDTMKATLEGATQEVTIIRRDLMNETNLPEHWDDMNGLQFMIVELDCNSVEYNNVKSSFTKTVNRPIAKIERIQNKYQHIAYTLRKEYMSEKNGPGSINERCLFHGTAPPNCHSINYSGFNRSFAGQNASTFGNGVYFAVNASYSARDIYSPADPITRKRFMYLAKVLLGHYTIGRVGMKTPPLRHRDNPFDLYDSLTNDQENPSIFVVFHDDQMYPEYLITFT